MNSSTNVSVASFDLTKEPWIPCIDAHARPIRLGLRDVFLRAHELRAIVHHSPFVTFALHRLLLAIAHRIFGPRTEAEWAELSRAGRWDEDRVRAYFDQWSERFDLFHPTRPFYQVAINPPESKRRSARLLVHELPQGNNSVLWDPYRGEDPVLTPADAACYLVAIQSFSEGGLKTGLGEGSAARESSSVTHLGRGLVVLLEGDSLFRTLLLNMVRYDHAQGAPFAFGETDLPAWESDRVIGNQPRRPDGYLDLLTWQPRRIQLFPAKRDGEIVVDRVLLARGEELPPNLDLAHIETMMPFAMSKYSRSDGTVSYVPIKTEGLRTVWRDSLSLMRSLTPDRVPARTVLAAAERLDRGLIPAKDRYRLAVFEAVWASSHNTVLATWVDERLPLPAVYLSDHDPMKRELLGEALQYAERGAKVLEQVASVLARMVVCYNKKESALSRTDRENLNQKKKTFFQQASLAYWAGLGERFAELVEEIAEIEDSEPIHDASPIMPILGGLDDNPADALLGVSDFAVTSEMVSGQANTPPDVPLLLDPSEAALYKWTQAVRAQVRKQGNAMITRFAPVDHRSTRAIAEAQYTLFQGLQILNSNTPVGSGGEDV